MRVALGEIETYLKNAFPKELPIQEFMGGPPGPGKFVPVTFPPPDSETVPEFLKSGSSREISEPRSAAKNFNEITRILLEGRNLGIGPFRQRLPASCPSSSKSSKF